MRPDEPPRGDLIRVIGAPAVRQGVAVMPVEVDKNAYTPICVHILLNLRTISR